MPRKLKPGEQPKDHARTMRKRPVSLTPEMDDRVMRLAMEMAQPGSLPNFSEALRKIIAEWDTGKASDGMPIKRGRKKNPKTPD